MESAWTAAGRGRRRGRASLALPFAFAGSAQAATTPAPDQPGQSGQTGQTGQPGQPDQTVVVQMASTAVRAQSVLAAAGLESTSGTAAPARRYILHVPPARCPLPSPGSVPTRAVSSASVAQAVHAVALSSTPDDPCYVSTCPAGTPSGVQTAANQAYLKTIGAPAAWAVTHGAGADRRRPRQRRRRREPGSGGQDPAQRQHLRRRRPQLRRERRPARARHPRERHRRGRYRQPHRGGQPRVERPRRRCSRSSTRPERATPPMWPRPSTTRSPPATG